MMYENKARDKRRFFFFSLKIRLYDRIIRGRAHKQCLHLADQIKCFFFEKQNRYDYKSSFTIIIGYILYYFGIKRREF